MFCTKCLVWSCTTGANDCEGHIVLAACLKVSVTSRGNLSHAVDSKVGVHELNDGTESIHCFSNGLSDEVTLVNNFVGSTDLAISLLRHGRDAICNTIDCD